MIDLIAPNRTIMTLHSAWNFAQGNIFGISVSGLYDTPSLLKLI